MATVAAINEATVAETSTGQKAREAVVQEMIEQEETAEFVYADGLIWADRKRMSGTPCFYGTSVPISERLVDTRKRGTARKRTQEKEVADGNHNE